ncbi:MAG TPA: hypothetical protein VGQ57_17715 [Polyangiaceae bacterium]|nr:hypothetical protein [Polyangiaceae bacterium]
MATEPPKRARPSDAELQTLRDAVSQKPRSRDARFALTRALMASDDWAGAAREAESWREHDAYNLVVVRLLGDIQMEAGERERARRTYSAIVELLPRDASARRALATVLKQGGDLTGAREQLLAALALADDRRTAFELADVEYRLGLPEASARFQAIADAPDVPESVRYPARQRLAQMAAHERVEAEARNDALAVADIEHRIQALQIHGGVENDIKVFLSWDTDRSDIDLWVTTPSGETVKYDHRAAAGGEELFDDVTTGYGPESFTAHAAHSGTYTVSVDYFGARPGAFTEARGEVIVVLDEGRKSERRRAFPYRLFVAKDHVTVAQIHVKGEGA